MKSPTTKTPTTIVDDVDEARLTELLDEHEHVAVLFYESLNQKTNKVLAEMQEMETADLDLEIVRSVREAVVVCVCVCVCDKERE